MSITKPMLSSEANEFLNTAVCDMTPYVREQFLALIEKDDDVWEFEEYLKDASNVFFAVAKLRQSKGLPPMRETIRQNR